MTALYSRQLVWAVVNKIHAGMTYTDAAVTYGIPVDTLKKWVRMCDMAKEKTR